MSYCCNQNEVGSLTCGGKGAFCSKQSKNPTVDYFACPYSYTYCGAKTSELIMHPDRRNNLRIEISNTLFVNAETCYYVFQVPSSDLDLETSLYFWEIEVTERKFIQMTLNNGTNLFEADGSIVVSTETGNKFQYSAENNKVFMSFTANVPT